MSVGKAILAIVASLIHLFAQVLCCGIQLTWALCAHCELISSLMASIVDKYIFCDILPLLIFSCFLKGRKKERRSDPAIPNVQYHVNRKLTSTEFVKMSQIGKKMKYCFLLTKRPRPMMFCTCMQHGQNWPLPEILSV